MLWAACCLGFFGFLRSGEFTVHSASGSSVRNPAPLLLSDIALDSIQRPTIVSVRIRQSKTDPFRLGVTLYLGITRDIVCPVKSMAAYLAVRSREQGPLFLYQDGSPLTRGRLVVVVREALSQMGLDSSNYAGHSFRIGAATTAAQSPLSKCWVDGSHLRMPDSSGLQDKTWQHCHQYWLGTFNLILISTLQLCGSRLICLMHTLLCNYNTV